MGYRLFFTFGKLYTYLIKRKFHFFGKHSIVKPFLNSSNEQFISIGDYVNIGSFCRITVSTAFGGTSCMSQNLIRITIGDHVDIAGGTFISANNDIDIGDHVIMAPDVFISDHDHGFLDIHKNLHQQPLTEGGYVRIGDNVFLGIKSTILKNVTIGNHSVVAAQAVVTKDVPPYCIVAGNPAKIIKTYDFRKKRWVKPLSSDKKL